MSLVTGAAVLLVFAVFGALMMTERIPTFVALAAMALGIALVGGLGPQQTVQTVIVDGSTMLANAILAVIFGAALGSLVKETGIAEDLVKLAAELGGDSPLVVGALLYVAIAASFTSIAGLGAFIMVATIVFPIINNVGFPKMAVAGVTLLAFANGVMFNPANWAFYVEVTGIELQDVIVWAVPTGAAAFVIGMGYVVYITRKTAVREQWAESDSARDDIERSVPTYSLIAPIIPVALVIAGVEIIPAFVVGILFAAVLSKPGIDGITQPQRTVNQITQSFHRGISDAGPAIALMVAIGWIVAAVFSEPVSSTMEPFLEAVIPENMLLYLAFFVVLAPLALYRGPLNLWGLGSGIIGALVAIGINPALITTTAISALRVQAPADPTNTHNAWTGGELDVNPNQIMKHVLPFAWATAAVGIVFSVLIFGL